MSTPHKFCSLLIILTAILASFSHVPSAHAATFTAVQNGDWNDTATWGGVLPQPTDDVLIPAGIIVTIPYPLMVTLDAGTTPRLFMVNLSAILLQTYRQHDPALSVLDLKAHYRATHYLDEIINALPVSPPPDLISHLWSKLVSFSAIRPPIPLTRVA